MNRKQLPKLNIGSRTEGLRNSVFWKKVLVGEKGRRVRGSRFLQLTLILVSFVLILSSAALNAKDSANLRIADRISDLRVELRDEAQAESVKDLVIINTGLDPVNKPKQSQIDNMVAIGFDDKNKKKFLVSLLRDTYVRYEEDDLTYKAKGGDLLGTFNRKEPEEFFRIVNESTDLNTAYYLTVNYETIYEVVNFLQMIRMEVTAEEVEMVNEQQEVINKELDLGAKIVKLEKAGVQPLNGLQAAAYASLITSKTKRTMEVSQDRHFVAVVRRIIIGMHNSNIAERERERAIIFEGKNNIDRDYTINMSARVLTYPYSGHEVWPDQRVYRRIDGVKYRFPSTAASCAEAMYKVKFGDLGYEVSDAIHEYDLFLDNVARHIEEEARKKELEKERKKKEEEARKAAEEAQKALEQQEQQQWQGIWPYGAYGTDGQNAYGNDQNTGDSDKEDTGNSDSKKSSSKKKTSSKSSSSSSSGKDTSKKQSKAGTQAEPAPDPEPTSEPEPTAEPDSGGGEPQSTGGESEGGTSDGGSEG